MDINFDKLASRDSRCIEEIKQALDIKCNYTAGKLIGRVLHALRSSLTYKESAELIQRLPDNIKIIYVSNWKLKPQKTVLRHLDNLVEAVLKNDEAHSDRVLNSEVAALEAIIATLKVLDKYTKILSYNFFKYPLKHELEEAMFKAA